MSEMGQRVGGRLRTFDEQDAIIADFDRPRLAELTATIQRHLPTWDTRTVGYTVYGCMRLHGITSSEAIAMLMDEYGPGGPHD